MVNDGYTFRVPREEKTDWKEDVRRALVSPAFAFSDEDFMNRVIVAVKIVGNSYPNWDAFKEVTRDVAVIVQDYREQFKVWKKKNLPTRRAKIFFAEKHLQKEMHEKIWEYLKNYCASRGLLIEGGRDSRPVDYNEGSSYELTE